MRSVGECVPHLMAIGIHFADAVQLRRIAMQLHWWHEQECGGGNAYASWVIARGRKVDGSFEYDDNGGPFMEYHAHSENKARYEPVRDMERGARKRLAKVLAKYPGLQAYVQGDPRGAALHILRDSDVPPNSDVSSCYTRGIAVYK